MKILLVSHGSFSKGLFETIEMIFGEQKDISYFGLYPQDSVEKIEGEIEAAVKAAVDSGEEVLVLSDLYFGSPFNATVRLMQNYNIYHVTGISVPLLLEAITQANAGNSAEQICDSLVELSQTSVVDVRKQLGDVLEN